jgi:hypothetical protein
MDHRRNRLIVIKNLSRLVLLLNVRQAILVVMLVRDEELIILYNISSWYCRKYSGHLIPNALSKA